MPQSHPSFRWLAVPLALALGCSGSGPVDGSVPDDATPDAGGDVQLPDVVRADGGDAGADAGTGPDAAADGGSDAAADGGPVAYDLDQHYARNTLAIVFRATRDYSRVLGPVGCSIGADGGLQFTARVCVDVGTTCWMIGGTSPASGRGAVVTLSNGLDPNIGATDVTVAHGAPYDDGGTALQNFHLQFRAPASGSLPAVTGIPGRTTLADAGDAWLLGCVQQ